MADVFPKFIVEGDTLVIAKCTYHYQIVNDKEKVKGGGWWRKDGDNFILHGSSRYFGSAALEDIKNCINKGNVFTDKHNMRNISKTHTFSYDTGTEIINLQPIPTEPPTPVNNCTTCQFNKLNPQGEPCHSCVDFKNWQPLTPVNKYEGEGIEKEAVGLVSKFYSEISGMELSFVSKLIEFPSGDSHFKTAKQCALIHCEGLKSENLSLLEMAVLHMDNRAQLVLNNRLSHLNHLKQSINKL